MVRQQTWLSCAPDGVRVRTAGFRVFGGDPLILEPYVDALTQEQAGAKVHRSDATGTAEVASGTKHPRT